MSILSTTICGGWMLKFNVRNKMFGQVEEKKHANSYGGLFQWTGGVRPVMLLEKSMRIMYIILLRSNKAQRNHRRFFRANKDNKCEKRRMIENAEIKLLVRS
ncbi:hypothetical protein Tcan_00843, partial [Toxocara canis]